jgi:hypothetical protein
MVGVSRRPTVITVFGTLNIVFGALGLVCTPVSLAMIYFVQKLVPDLPIPPATELWNAGRIITSAVGVAADIILICAGFALLRMRPWARIASIAYGIYAIAFLLGGVVVAYSQSLWRILGEAKSTADVVAVLAAVATTLTGMIYPVLLIIFMTRRKTVMALVGQSQPPEASAAC